MEAKQKSQPKPAARGPLLIGKRGVVANESESGEEQQGRCLRGGPGGVHVPRPEAAALSDAPAR